MKLIQSLLLIALTLASLGLQAQDQEDLLISKNFLQENAGTKKARRFEKMGASDDFKMRVRNKRNSLD